MMLLTSRNTSLISVSGTGDGGDMILSSDGAIVSADAVFVPPRTKVLALDMDGTLCTVGNEISPDTLAALTDFAVSGGSVLITTGRSVSAATEVVDAYLPGIIEYCVAMDGACVVQAPDWDVVWSAGFTGAELARLLRAIDAAVPGCYFGALPLAGADSDLVSGEGYVDLLRSSDAVFAQGMLSRDVRHFVSFCAVSSSPPSSWLLLLVRLQQLPFRAVSAHILPFSCFFVAGVLLTFFANIFADGRSGRVSLMISSVRMTDFCRS
jgi:hypothetical protein